MTRYRAVGVLCLAAFALLACRREPALEGPVGPSPLPQVRLAVVIVVDQLGWESLVRLEPALTGGLRDMLEGGVVFSNAHHLHAETLTGPGHASLATGLHPRHHGIIRNEWYDRQSGKQVYCVEDDDGTISPRRLIGTTVADWIRAADSRSRVFTAGGKDRGSVLLGGVDANAAFWYDRESGRFTSSSYYRQGTPAWLESFHDERPAERWFGELWEPLPQTLGSPGLTMVQSDRGDFPREFPHAIGDATIWPDATYYADLYATPFSDTYLAELARALVDGEGLGRGDRLDFLGLSFSAPDTVGHIYGQESAEFVDTILRLDRTLGQLLAFLERRIGGERLLVVLSSDHGVAPLPEARRRLGLDAGRKGAYEIACAQAVLGRLQRRFGPGIRFEAPGYLDSTAVAEAGLDQNRILAAAARFGESCPEVAEIWTRPDMLADKPPEAPHGLAYWRSFHPERSPDLLFGLQPWYVPLRGTGTTHGSPWPYDSHVPLAFLLPQRQSRHLVEPVGTVDLAPTMATLLGLPRAANLDGVDLADLIIDRPKPPSPPADAR